MVIYEIYVVHVASFKPKGDPPVASNRNAPQSSSVPSEWMQSVPWQIEIARLAGGIQVCQGEGDSFQLVGGLFSWGRLVDRAASTLDGETNGS